MANVAKLLHSTTRDASFLRNITIDDVDDAKLREARRAVREHLKGAFAATGKWVIGVEVTPRFFTQGSFSYRTLNAPAWSPPQQMDMDYGCYLPLSFVKGAEPKIAATKFFDFVDGALGILALQKGWSLVTKPTCTRLVIDDDAHIDVPLYAIPDKEFVQLKEARAARQTLSLDSSLAKRSAVQTWDDLPSDSVLLAHRDENWVPSDPRKIHNWFVNAVDAYDEVLRRICRYLKAWRDHHSPDLDGVSSILLMVCAFNALEELGPDDVADREDQALLQVVERLPRLLAGPVLNPTDDGERLCKRLTDNDRSRAVSMARDLHNLVRAAMSGTADRQGALRDLQAAFGSRIPDRPDLVEITVAAQAEVRSHPSRIVPAPMVGRSQSG